MANITKTFVYPQTDDYLSQSNTQGRTATWTYEGPERIVVYVDSTTNKRTPGGWHEPDDRPTPLNQYKVEIDCNSNPLLCTLFGASRTVNANDVPNLEVELPSGGVYRRPDPIMPDHVFEVHDITYDPTSERFETPYPWKRPHMSWEEIRRKRATMLHICDDKVAPDLPQVLKDHWTAYIHALRDLPVVYGKAFGATLTSAGTGYAEGDVITVASNVLDTTNDLTITVLTVDSNGEILTFSVSGGDSNNKPSATHANVSFTTSSSGTGATFDAVKINTFDPWMVELPLSPDEDHTPYEEGGIQGWDARAWARTKGYIS